MKDRGVKMRIFITGANRGLGIALVKKAVENGHTIIAGTRNGDNPSGELKQLIEQFPEKILSVSLDVTNESSVEAAANEVQKQLGEIDVIINNAGVLLDRGTPIEKLDLALFHQTMEVNLYGPLRVIKHFLPLLKKGTSQSILNISSESGSLANAYGGDYSYAISKAALNMFSKQIKHLLKEEDIPVLAIHPGWIRTDMGGENATGSPTDTANNLMAIIEKKKQVDDDLFFILHDGTKMA